MTTYIQLSDFYKKIKIMDNISGILSWDSSTMMPKNSFKARSEELAFLSSMQQKFLRSEQLGYALANVKQEKLSDWQKANIREIKLCRDSALAVDPQLIEAYIKVTTEGKVIWEQARKNNNFQTFAPQLKKIISQAREIGKSRQEYFKTETAYDGLLDQYDHGSRQQELDVIFSNLRQWLPEMINKVISKQESTEIIQFDQSFSIEKQKELALFCIKQLGFDLGRGRIDTSVHPFCGGSAFDVRITTRYDVKNFITGMHGVMHETGHALYNQNLPEDYKYQAVGEYRSMSIHESQSLFVEKHIGSSREFWEYITPHIHKIFKLQKMHKAYTAENFYNFSNNVTSSFIRVDADEVTYPAHIILRYDIEKELISRNLDVNDIPEVWNKSMKELLGITPSNDNEGCLQDIHWAMGAFGYFPTYLKGAILSAQIAQAMKQHNIDLKKIISSGDFKAAIKFLKEKIHSKGSLLSSADLIKSVASKELDIIAYKEYLEEKFLNA